MQLLTFLNAFTLLNDANRLAVFAAGAGGCQLAFCSPSCQPAPAAAAGGHVAADPWPPSAAILSGLQRVMQQAAAASEAAGGQHAAAAGHGSSGGGGGSSCQLSSALSRVLCFIHSMQRRAAAAQGSLLGGSSGGALPAAERLQPARLLCLTAAPDVPSQYIGVMNAIFSAQVGGCLWYARLGQLLQRALRAPGCSCFWLVYGICSAAAAAAAAAAALGQSLTATLLPQSGAWRMLLPPLLSC